MSPNEALELLRGSPLVVAGRIGLPDAKRLLARCLESGIPAMLRRPPDPG